MERKRFSLLSVVSFTFALTFTILSITYANDNQAETYIVHLNSPNGKVFATPEDRYNWYNSFLSTSSSGSNEQASIIHAYHNVLTGFAAKMSPDQVKVMETYDGFISATPERVYELHTTHTPKFLGLSDHTNLEKRDGFTWFESVWRWILAPWFSQPKRLETLVTQNLGVWRGSNYGEGIIIGVLDTGLAPSEPSFWDAGVPTPPKRWRGKCEVTVCNNKLIGMRDFTNSSNPFDRVGHGTLSSSIAGGNFADYASVYGNANGTAAGMAPLAHVAMYKVYNSIGCSESAILAGMDAAIDEGVDVLSLSFGGPSLPFHQDSIAIGAFSAVQKGIFISCSAGNSGPFHSTLSNEAPWILTVGASTVDRKIRATVSLGNKALLDGESVFQPKDFPQNFMPLVYPGLNGGQQAAWCAPRSIKGINIRGKVVLCDEGGGIGRIDKGRTVKDAGGAAMILTNQVADGVCTKADAHVLPASHVGYKDGVLIKTYMNSSSSPVAAIIFRGTVIGVKDAPEVASFSSRGPSLESPGIVKHDIIGPGVSVLAASPFPGERSGVSHYAYNVISGTSMSCPHLAGISALLKSEHPDWSPAAIKSAIMTTADQLNLNGKPIQDEQELPANIFAIGSGHVNPSKASDPGLIFDIQSNDYIPYLCGLGYTCKQVEVIVQKRVTCSKVIPEAQLNYPSFAVTLGFGDEKSFTRTVTNVGAAYSIYTMKAVNLPLGLLLDVSPRELIFTEVNQKSTYEVKFTRDSKYEVKTSYAEGSMTWSDGKHSVRTPFSIEFA